MTAVASGARNDQDPACSSSNRPKIERAVEARNAQPVDGAIPAHQRGTVPVGQQRVLSDRTTAHRSVGFGVAAREPPGARVTHTALDRRFDVVVDASRREQPVAGTLEHRDARLRREIVAPPANAVVQHGALQTVVGTTVERPDGFANVDRPLAAVRAEHHRPIVGGFGDHCDRPRDVSAIVVQMRETLHDGPPTTRRGGHGLGAGVALGQHGLTLLDELPQLPVAADVTGVGVEDRDLARPDGLERAGVAMFDGGQVLPDGIDLTGRSGLPARQLDGRDEIRKPRHSNLRDHGVADRTTTV